MIRRVLFVDTAHPVLEDELSGMGFVCDHFKEKDLTVLHGVIGQYFGVIIRSKFLFDRDLIDRADKLKFIGRVGSGMENIDLEYAESLGIACLNSPEGSRDAVGEHTLTLLLTLFNKILIADRGVRQGKWQREANRGLEVKDKVVGIIGYGNMGSAFAQKLKGFGAEVLAYDKYKQGFGDENVKEVSYDEIFKYTDILSLHVPLTDETHYLVDDKYLENFKKDIYLLNTARGKVVKTKDLVENLKSGKVLGAGIDVLEYEMTSFEDLDISSLPDDFQYLAAASNVVLTPHIAGWTIESNYKLAKVLADKIRKQFT